MTSQWKRGERKARRMLGLIDSTGLSVDVVRAESGRWDLRFLSVKDQTTEQRALAADLVLFSIGYPRCYGTMVRLLREGNRGQ